ncbi:hypothetical protein [Cohaesibacter intestini]|uniref:hypothetical protein n=1 Tax=Cohaesibacter intestini TaxID=2211145 RepID=UPI000DEBE350|nr:hypothetical protein [Cohaesibacter intestini]
MNNGNKKVKLNTEAANTPSNDELLAPYETMPTFGQLDDGHKKRFAKFLRFTHLHGISVITKQTFLDYSAKHEPPNTLFALRTTFNILFSGHPVIGPALQAAITEKTIAYDKAHRKPRKKAKRKPAKFRSPVTEWPVPWLQTWAQLQNGHRPSGGRAFSESLLENMQDVISEYVWTLKTAGVPVVIDAAGVRILEQTKKDRAPSAEEAAYKNQGYRARTLQTATMRLRQFGKELGINPQILADFNKHINKHEGDAAAESPQKFGRYERLPSYKEIYRLACQLLKDSSIATHRKTKNKLRNQAAIIALWLFIPLRITDGLLRWGDDITYDTETGQYKISVATNKTGQPVRSPLNPKLNKFFDILVFDEVNPEVGAGWLNQERQRLIAAKAPVFHDHLGKMYVKKRPSKVWREHFGTGDHIARTMAHTELGKRGAKGVAIAMALCAQRDVKTRLAYQADALSDALMLESQSLMDQLVANTLSSPDEDAVEGDKGENTR